MGKWLAGIAAVVIAGVAVAYLTSQMDKPPPPQRIAALEGTWEFVRFEGTQPPTSSVAFRPTAISFHADANYSASVVMGVGGNQIAGSGAGTYTPVDAKTIKLEQKGSQPGTQIYQYVVAGTELKLTAPGTGTMVFKKA